MLIIISQVVITSNYPLYGTGFWGGNPANNYGFGNSNISANIENMQNNTTKIPQATAMPQMTAQPITSQVQQQPYTSAWDTVKQWGNNFAGAIEAGVVGYATGASLGNFDEAMGGAATTFGVDYKGAREAVRQLQNNLSQQHPYGNDGIGRKAFTQGINQGLNYLTDNFKNIFYDKYE